MPADNGWEKWQQVVLQNQARYEKRLDSIDKRLETIAVEIATLKVKAGIWGGLAGLIGAALVIAGILLRKMV